MPDVATTAEAGYPEVIGTAWNGFVGPTGTQREIISKLNAEISHILQAVDTKESFAKLGMQPVGGSPDEFARFEKTEAEKWAKVIKAARMTPQ